MENDRPFRHELKYLMSKRDMDCCLSRIGQFASPDPHAPAGRYFVRSLYFDDMYASAYEEKESGIASRKKFRIRVYDLDRGHISLEEKIKEDQYVMKKSALLSEDELGMIMRGDTDFLLKRPEETAKGFALGYRNEMLRPEVIVDYDRIPFVSPYGDVRITFDMNVRAVTDVADLFSKDAPAYDALGQDMLIMEVKYTQYLPDIFRAVLPDSGCRLAVSKYMLCDAVKRGIG